MPTAFARVTAASKSASDSAVISVVPSSTKSKPTAFADSRPASPMQYPTRFFSDCPPSGSSTSASRQLTATIHRFTGTSSPIRGDCSMGAVTSHGRVPRSTMRIPIPCGTLGAFAAVLTVALAPADSGAQGGAAELGFTVPAGYAQQRQGDLIILAPANVGQTPCVYGVAGRHAYTGSLEN